MRKNRLAMAAVLTALLLVISACAEQSPEAEQPAAPATTMEMADTTMGDMDMADTTMGEMDMGDDEHGDFDFGEPATATEADRVVELVTRDDFTYTPADLTVAIGEKITFRVTNEGVISHDFLLGRSDMQDEHDIEMAEMGGMMMADEPNAFMVEPGQTKELTWHFTEAGEVLIGCHVPGHYAAGMKATIQVEA